MSKYKIGIVGWKTGENSFGATVSYLEFIEQYGEPIILMPEHEVRTDLDLLVLPGGADVDTARYGEAPSYRNSKTDLFKEHFDKFYLQQYIDNGTSIFGICRGHQSLAVHFGGSLVQDMYHETNPVSDPYKVMHEMKLTVDLPKLGLHKNQKSGVNSRHHQVVDKETLPDDLVVIGEYWNKSGFGEIEMMAHKTLPIVGYQPHPEDCYNQVVDRAINHLLRTNKTILS